MPRFSLLWLTLWLTGSQAVKVGAAAHMRFQVSASGCVFMFSSHARHTSSGARSNSTAHVRAQTLSTAIFSAAHLDRHWTDQIHTQWRSSGLTHSGHLSWRMALARWITQGGQHQAAAEHSVG